MRQVKYKAIPVTQILRTMKDVSSIMLDLAYEVILSKDDKLSFEVEKLERYIDYLNYHLVAQVMLATRDAEDVERGISLLRVAASTNRISDAAADIANIVVRKLEFPRLLQTIMRGVDERVFRAEVTDQCLCEGIDIANLALTNGIDVIAIRRDRKWMIAPENSIEIQKRDILVCRGHKEMSDPFKKFCRGEIDNLEELKNSVEDIKEEVVTVKSIKQHLNEIEGQIIKTLRNLKDKSELMLDLAYSSLLLGSELMAEEVLRMENTIDELHTMISLQSIDLLFDSSSDYTPREVIGVLRLTTALEEIADAAAQLAELLKRGLTGHPLLKQVINDSDETIAVMEVEEGSDIIGRTVGDVEIDVGMWVAAIRRQNTHFINPSPDMAVQEDDVLICRALKEGRAKLEALTEEST